MWGEFPKIGDTNTGCPSGTLKPFSEGYLLGKVFGVSVLGMGHICNVCAVCKSIYKCMHVCLNVCRVYVCMYVGMHESVKPAP